MARISLKNIIGKNRAITPVIADLLTYVSETAWVEDEKGIVLAGRKGETAGTIIPIVFEDEIIGVVKGNENVAMIANLLNHLVEKEAEKRKLGNEVLNLYQEINVIFNFSEKLSQAIEPDVIAGFTLEQAVNSIRSDSGVVVLWDAQNMQMEVPAASGEPLFNGYAIKDNMALLLHIGINGQSAIINDLDELKRKGIVSPEVESLVYAAMKVKHRIMGAIILAAKNADQFSAGDLKLLITLALQSSSAIESAMLYEKNIREAKEREEAILRIHEVTKKFVPNEFIRALGKESLLDVKLGDQAEKIVTVLFTDIRDFTTLSEKMTPEENFRFVSSFNARLGPIIRANNGFINQYLGDSIMAIFPESADDAMHAAIAMQASVNGLNQERRASGLPLIHAGIGMHTGQLIMGITGDEQRLDAATISDTVNTAARLESLTKYYRSPLLLSRETYDNLTNKEQFHLRHLGSVRLKGKHNLLNVMECFDGQDAIIFEKKLKTLPEFNRALALYHDQEFEQAVEVFKNILTLNPEDTTAGYFLRNAITYHREGIPENWTGAEEMIYK
jgi:class 3 adenylate cyclase